MMRITKTFSIFLTIFSLSLNSCASVSNVIDDPDYSPSFGYRMSRMGIKISGTKKLFKHSPENIIKRSERFNNLLSKKPPNSLYNSKKYSVEKINFGGHPCFIISSAQNSNTEKALVYLHGGGFVVSIQTFHWNLIKLIVDKLHIPVIVPLYPLYPETNPENIIRVVDSAFSYAYDKFPGAKVYGMGDSAGAFLLLSYCHYLSNTEDAHHKDAKRFPDELICISVPQVIGIDEDIIKEMKAIDKKDAMISIDILHTLPALYNLTAAEFNWFTTPLYGDFSNFPPMTIIMGTHEIFYPLIPPFVEQLKANEKEVDFYTGYGMIHCWPLLPRVKEAEFIMNIILDIIKRG